MVTIKAAKSKGSQFEYDCQYSLSQNPKFIGIYRTSERGFQLQYDLYCKCSQTGSEYAFECKRLKGISWNQLDKFYDKLVTVSNCRHNYLLFKSNHQPCLVYYRDGGIRTIQRFEDIFGVEFLKHPSTRNKNDKKL